MQAPGRDPGYGPIIDSVKSLKIALHSGEVVTSSWSQNPDQFYTMISGYGLLGVILEAEIELTDNLPLKSSTTKIKLQNYTRSIEQEAG